MEIPKDVNVIDWEANYMWFDTDGVLYSMPKPGMDQPELSREETAQRMEEFKKLVGNKKVCMVMESNANSKAPKKEDRDFIADQLSQVTKAMAIITTSPLSRMIANLFFGLKPPAYPVKFCKNEIEAKDWIKQYL